MSARRMLRFGTLCATLSQVVAAASACGGRVDDRARSDEVGSAKDAGGAQPGFDGSSVVPPDASRVLDAASPPPDCPALALAPACTPGDSIEWGMAACNVEVDPYFAQPETLKSFNMRFRQFGWTDSSDQDGMLTYVG